MRLQAIGEARVAIAGARKGAQPAEAAPRPRSGIAGWIAAAVLAVIAAASLWEVWRSKQPVEKPLVRLDVDLGPEISLPSPDNSPLSTVALSPDGTRLRMWPVFLRATTPLQHGGWTSRRLWNFRAQTGRSDRSFRQTDSGSDSLPWQIQQDFGAGRSDRPAGGHAIRRGKLERGRKYHYGGPNGPDSHSLGRRRPREGDGIGEGRICRGVPASSARR